MPQSPTFAEEEKLHAQGYHLIAGIDEVGRGALAGPVAAAAVILPYPLSSPWLEQVRDSKLLNAKKREYLCQQIQEKALHWGVGLVSSRLIDELGIAPATRLAMRLAVEKLAIRPHYLLIDFLRLPELRIRQKGIVDGDSLCFCISCASILAKVARDHLMEEMGRAYPGYGFAQHKGYGTKEHLTNLVRLGVSPIHRRSFSPIGRIPFNLDEP